MISPLISVLAAAVVTAGPADQAPEEADPSPLVAQLQLLENSEGPLPPGVPVLRVIEDCRRIPEGSSPVAAPAFSVRAGPSEVPVAAWSQPVDGVPGTVSRACIPLVRGSATITVAHQGSVVASWVLGEDVCLARYATLQDPTKYGSPPGSDSPPLSTPTSVWRHARGDLTLQIPCEGPGAAGPPSESIFTHHVAPPAPFTASCGSGPAVWTVQLVRSDLWSTRRYTVSCGFDTASRGDLVIREGGKEVARYEESDFAWVPSWSWDPPGPGRGTRAEGE